MDNIIETLYFDWCNDEESNKKFLHSSEYKKYQEKYDLLYGQLEKLLYFQKSLLIECSNASNDVSGLEVENAFRSGFKIAFQLFKESYEPEKYMDE